MMGQAQNLPPLMFIVSDGKAPHRSTRAIKSAKTSHISSRYRYWSKAHHRDLALDSTTKAILNGSSKPTHKSPSRPQRSPPVQLTSPISSSSDDADAEDCNEVLVRVNSNTPELESDEHGAIVRPWRGARRQVEEFVGSPLTVLGSSFFDIFTPSAPFKYDVEIKSNLYFYLKVIKPFAMHLMQSWDWCDNLPQIQASPCLTYAISTFASVFMSGMLRGGRGVVLPPPSEHDNSYWKIPPWLRLHTKCLSELNNILGSKQQKIDDATYQAILFLYRLSILLSDGEAGRMHLHALKRTSALLQIEQSTHERELAILKVNIIGAFLHSQSTVLVRKTPNAVTGVAKEVVEIDRKFWQSDREWYSHRAGLAGRSLCWRTESPGSSILPDTLAAITRMDPGIGGLLSMPEQIEVQRCYQIGIFFWHYLCCISFNTSAPIVRSNLSELQHRLSNLNLEVIRSACYTTLANILVAGAHASDGKMHERMWFIKQIVRLYPDIDSLDTLWHLRAEFFDALSSHFKFIEQIWQDIVAERQAASRIASIVITDQFVRPIQHSRPTSYAPDMSKPLPVFELEDLEAAELEKSVHRAPGLLSVAC